MSFDPTVAAEALAGLLAPRKTLPAKLFYDEEGCRLFYRITALPEYYLTRTERTLLPAVADHVSGLSDTPMTLVEYGASDEEKKSVFDYASEKKTLDDIDLQELSATDRRVLLQTAVVISFVDGAQTQDESTMLVELAHRLRIPDDEAKAVIHEAATRAKEHLGLL